MGEESRIDPQHRQTRSVLRVLGPMVLIVGGILVAIGLVSFFSAFGSFEPSRYFWCVFVGGPLVVAGLALTSYGFMGAIARYQGSRFRVFDSEPKIIDGNLAASRVLVRLTE